ncbi:MAG: hypothetical protein ACPG8W_02885 [Candidatus Promineifilaceae bacterium]
MTKQNRVNVAWVVLLTSFFICTVLTVSAPFGYRWVVQNARRPLSLTAQGIQGTPIERERGDQLPFEAEAREYDPPARLVTTGEAETGLFQIVEPESGELLARIQALGNTDVRVDRAYQARFKSSTLQPHLFLTLRKGRIRVSLPVESADAQPVIVYVELPDGSQAQAVGAGAYSVQANRDMVELAVLAGEGQLSSAESTLNLTVDQRATVREGILSGPLSPDRNLIQNGDFSDGFDGWIPLAWVVERDDQPTGATEINNAGGEPTLSFRRVGEGNARNDLRQEISQNVVAYSDLRLLIGLRVVEQSLYVCGSEGFECPLTVRIEYETAQGEQFAWEQGYYAPVEGLDNTAPIICSRCGWPVSLNEHRLVPRLGEIAFFESPNILATLGQEGIRPVRIHNITLTAEGHSFGVDVVEVSLVARESVATEGYR